MKRHVLDGKNRSQGEVQIITKYLSKSVGTGVCIGRPVLRLCGLKSVGTGVCIGRPVLRLCGLTVRKYT